MNVLVFGHVCFRADEYSLSYIYFFRCVNCVEILIEKRQAIILSSNLPTGKKVCEWNFRKISNKFVKVEAPSEAASRATC